MLCWCPTQGVKHIDGSQGAPTERGGRPLLDALGVIYQRREDGILHGTTPTQQFHAQYSVFAAELSPERRQQAEITFLK